MWVEATCPVDDCGELVVVGCFDSRTECAAGHLLAVEWEEIIPWQGGESVWAPVLAGAQDLSQEEQRRAV